MRVPSWISGSIYKIRATLNQGGSPSFLARDGPRSMFSLLIQTINRIDDMAYNCWSEPYARHHKTLIGSKSVEALTHAFASLLHFLLPLLSKYLMALFVYILYEGGISLVGVCRGAMVLEMQGS